LVIRNFLLTTGVNDMATAAIEIEGKRYAQCIRASKKVRWDIDADVIRGRTFDCAQKFLPDGLTLPAQFAFVTLEQMRLVSQIQGRTYANMFGLVERYIGAKVLEISNEYWLGDQTALEALIRFSDEELKHQELFRRIEELVAQGMPAGYVFEHDPNRVARAVLSKSTWAVLALTCNIELFTQAHYKQSIEPDDNLSGLFKDVFLYHWREECQHAVLDELEWRREDLRMSDDERDSAVDDLIELVGAVDGILQAQAGADARYFMRICGDFGPEDATRLEAGFLKAYRWQHIGSGVQHPRLKSVLQELVSAPQLQRIQAALAPLMQ
jgi:hypothetical protein